MSVALGVLAFTYEGFTTTDVDLNDGGVWVTKTETLQLGRINVQAEELDAGLISPTANLDVLQDGERVLLHNREASTAIVVDPVQVATGNGIQLPPQGEISMDAGVVSVLDPADGNLWAMPYDELAAFSPEGTDPLLELGEGAAAVVGRDGTVHAVSPREGQQVEIRLGEDGALEEPELRDRGELTGMQDPVVTAVGADAVTIDVATTTLLVPGGAVEVPEDAAVQLPGDAADRVIVATPESLVRQPLSGGDAEVEQRVGGGDAVRPVQLGGCVHAVWPASATYYRDCQDDAADLDVQVDGMDGSPVVFRVNRDAVVLNQYQEGSSWLLADQLILVDNWEDLIPPQSQEESEEQDEESTEDLLTNQPPPINEENSDPVANDDGFGARPGRSTLLPVLWNDSDPDGDVLTASVISGLPQGVTVAPVANDSQLQVQLPADYPTGSFSFRYQVQDGRGGDDDAQVTVTVRGEAENTVPEPLREQAFAVEQGGEYEYQVLDNWFDPDGDDMYLVGAVSDSGDTIRTDPSGRLIYVATGEVGIQTVTVTISDGRAETTGEVTVDIRERGDAPPLANADFVQMVEGREATIRPLLNDFSPSGRPLRLASVEPAAGLDMTWDANAGTIRITDGPIGTHYMTYLVADGPLPSTGRIRVDIRTPDEEARPIAVRDVALVPQGGSTLVDLLQNDVDPAGGVLVVTQISLENGAPVTVELRDRRIVSIVDNRGLDSPFRFTYTVSNGRFSETGTVEVIPVTPPEQPRAPVAVDDRATIRAGDYATVDVLGNDFSPDGTPFELVEQIVETSFESDAVGVAFIAEGKLRVHVLAEEPPTRATVTYEVKDDFGNRDSATVALTIVPREAEQNAPPAPVTVTSRVLAGSTVRIPIPLEGIDPDGDGVELVGYDTAPEGGRILPEIGPDFFDFEAFPDSSGAVDFTYRVRDRYGAESTATVVIGIAQASDVNQPPFAQTDEVTVRPGRAIAIDVLANDTDPDQDPLSIVVDGLQDLPEQLSGATVNPERQTVDIVSPTEVGTYQFTYGIVDSKGAPARGTVVVDVAEDAPLLAPIARDDPLPRDGVVLGEPLDVPVLDNDLDPDGDPSELDVSVVTGPGTVTAAGAVQVVPSEAFQVVTYRVTDIDGLTAEAFVSVPPVRDQAPFVSRTEPIQIPSGELREIPLRDYVSVPSGKPPRITTGDSVTGVNHDDTGLIKDTQTLQFRSPAGYVGPASITFEVTDGSGPDDPEGITAMLTIPIEVLPSSAVPPTFAGTVLRPEAGEGSTTFDLRDATTDPDPGDLEDMRFELAGGSMAGVTVGLDGPIISADAVVDAVPGTTGSFQIVAIDPAGNRAPGTVVVEVVATNRPLAEARPDSGEATASEPIMIDALANDFNPFATDGRPLRIISAETIAGQGAVANSERDVTITPGADFSGVLTVRYTVQDATERTERQVTGTITLNVKARPDAPPRPNVDAVGDSQVTLTWAPPPSNGAPIQTYTVRSVDGAISQDCAATTCTITGLSNNVTYRFQVTATNEVGESDPSTPSNEARPDVRPEQPAPPTVERGDGQVALTWEAPVNNGSPIQYYTVEISPPAPGGVVQQQVQGTSYTWGSLTNGVSYTFRIQATNLAPEPSDFSAYSQAVTPAGAPFQVASVRATPDRSIPGEVQVRVEWDYPPGQNGIDGNNGAAITGYTVTPSNGAAAQTVSGTSANFGFDATGQNVTFTVVANNDVGSGQPSPPSAPIRVFTAPGAPSDVSATDGNTDSVVTWTPGASNGLRADEIRYEITGGGAGAQSFGPGGTYTRMDNNGGPYTFQVRAYAVVDGVEYSSGTTSASNQSRPFGAVGAPSASVADRQQRQITFAWSSPQPNGRSLTTEIRVDGGAWRSVAASGRETVGGAPGSDHWLEVRVTSSAFDANNDPLSGHGSQRSSNRADGRIPDLPEPSLSLSKGGQVTAPNGQIGTNYVLTWTDLVPGQQYRYECYSTRSGNFQGGTWTAPRANGTSPRDTYTFCMSGYSGQGWMTLSANGKTWTTQRVDWP
ncbi:Ig-like domain-containing protein [Agrococcus terreus]|uniref:Fibronectin type III n=1 Tax=Agrococcus terreus TaxID=574649 RepID=A0ABQ2KBN1_9MICO|nr:Ig-like domain-containing protein [Agrococcus terreus]GGN78665.1 fibronectin type III [Agrococcus terreus]